MASTTLLYIAWPLTLGLSFMAGSMIISNKSTTEISKDGNQSPKVSRKNSFSKDSTNETTATTNRRTSITSSRAGQDGYTQSFDIKEIVNTNNPLERMTKLLSVIHQLGPGDFEQVLADFRKTGMTRDRKTEHQMLLTAWAKINPEGALSNAKENTGSFLANNIILSTWAEYAPDAAIQWAKLNHEGDKANPYLIGIIKGIASTNPERATEILQDLPYGTTVHHKAFDAIITHVRKLDTEKTAAWLATIKDEKNQAKAIYSLVYPLARKDPQAAVDWLKTLPENNQKRSLAFIARTWAAQDIDKAAKWTSSLKGSTSTYAASGMIDRFIYSDPNKAAAWMKTLSGRPDYQRVVRIFMENASSDYPEIALANIDQLGDNRIDRSRQMILMKWATKDKGAATKWMQNNSMSVAVQKKILSKAAKGIDKGWLEE